MNPSGQTVCLFMIVRNEEHVIRRCLASLLPLIDTWAIVDTGSTDGTQEAVREFLREAPGELFERPWVDFATNRTESLALAAGRATYLLTIDADEVLELDEGFTLPLLEADAYDFAIDTGPLRYYKTQLLRDGMPWRYDGVLHEHVACAAPYTPVRLPGVRTVRWTDGARARDPLTFRKDAVLLEGALLREPENARHMFYLAQCYSDAGEADLALDRYRRRVAMGGWPEEAWCALYRVALLEESKGGDWPPVMEAYLAAWAYRPERAEPLYRIGMHYQALRQFALSHLFLGRAMAIAYPEADVLFTEKSVYDYLLPLEFAVACFYVGEHEEAVRVCNRLLDDTTLLPEQVEHVTRNRQFSLDALVAEA